LARFRTGATRRKSDHKGDESQMAYDRSH
jgi:hypothetical protein